MARKALISLAFAVVLVALPAVAEEIVHFTNGTTMVIESHELDGGTVRLNLGGDAFMEFPGAQIDKIETASGDVAISSGASNRIVPSNQGARVTGSRSPRQRGRTWSTVTDSQPDDPRIGVDSNGIAVTRPFANSTNEKRRTLSLTGRRQLQGRSASRQGLPPGTSHQVGRRYVLPGKEEKAPNSQLLHGFTKREDPATPKKKKEQ
jgi:hypothetical protein